MSLKGKDDYIYSGCDNIERLKPDFVVNEDIAKEIGNNYRTLPTFEQYLFNHVLTQHYSLDRNEFLRCRWREYKRQVEGRVFAPFQFPDNRDVHFHDCAIRFRPSESVHNRTSPLAFRKHMSPGPGVDFGSFGAQKPIPEELMIKRGVVKKVNDGVEGKHPYLKKRAGKEKIK